MTTLPTPTTLRRAAFAAAMVVACGLFAAGTAQAAPLAPPPVDAIAGENGLSAVHWHWHRRHHHWGHHHHHRRHFGWGGHRHHHHHHGWGHRHHHHHHGWRGHHHHRHHHW